MQDVLQLCNAHNWKGFQVKPIAESFARISNMQPKFPQLPQLCLAYLLAWTAKDEVINVVKHILRSDQCQFLRKLSIDRQVLHQIIKIKERHSTILLVELSQPQDNASKLQHSVLHSCISLQLMQLILYCVVIGIRFYLLRETCLDQSY